MDTRLNGELPISGRKYALPTGNRCPSHRQADRADMLLTPAELIDLTGYRRPASAGSMMHTAPRTSTHGG